MTMLHTGRLYLGTTKPQAGVARDGAFQLLILAMDRIGDHQTQLWRLIWCGPDAERFHHQHSIADLAPGTALQVQCTAARVYQSTRLGVQIFAHVVECEIVTQRPPIVRKKLSKPEQPASVAA